MKKKQFHLGFAFQTLVAVITLISNLGTLHAQGTSVGGGTLTWTTTQSSGRCGPSGTVPYTLYTFSNFQFAYAGTTYTFGGNSTSYYQSQGAGCPPNGPTSPGYPLQLPSNFGNASIVFIAEAGGGGEAYTVASATYAPAYNILSILYAPPGNKSSQGYGSGTSYGTTSSVTDSFSTSNTITFTGGAGGLLSGSESIGFGSSSSNTSSYAQSITDAIGLTATDMSNSTYNPKTSNAIDHALDEFVIWLNPQVTVISNDSQPVSYSLSMASPNASVDGYADVLVVPAVAMMPTPGSVTSSNPTGISSVPASFLNPQPYPGTSHTMSKA